MAEQFEDVQGGAADRLAKAEELVARGNELLLRQTRPADAAGAFAQALQLAPQLVTAHLGMAQANLALGHPQIAREAAEYVQRLAPDTTEAQLAQTIAQVIDRQYQPALDTIDALAQRDPGRPYVHALRGYILRCLRRDYDAALAEAKAGRLSSGVDMRGLFPRIEFAPPPAPTFSANAPRLDPVEQVRAQTQWRPSPQTAARRQMVRLSFMTRGYPVATMGIIAVCLIVYILEGAFGGNFLSINASDFTDGGIQINYLVAHGEWWRVLTAMFLHLDITHIFFNMLSLYFIGPLLERIYGPGRFLAIYFLTGIIGGLTFLILAPNEAALGASGAIAGIFGAIGAFFFANRQQLGPIADNVLRQWFFWLILNVAINYASVLGFSGGAPLGWQAHLGGLVSGIVLGVALAPRRRR